MVVIVWIGDVRLVVGVVVVLVEMVRWRTRSGVQHVARRTVEGQVDEPPGVKTGEGGSDRQRPEAEAAQIAADGISGLDDRVLAEEPRKADRREGDADAGERQRADEHE